MAGSHGQRHTHERTTNDSDGIIGSALDIDAAHITEVRRTNKKGMTNHCRRDYRNRIKKKKNMPFSRRELSRVLCGWCPGTVPGGTGRPGQFPLEEHR